MRLKEQQRQFSKGYVVACQLLSDDQCKQLKDYAQKVDGAFQELTKRNARIDILNATVPASAILMGVTLHAATNTPMTSDITMLALVTAVRALAVQRTGERDMSIAVSKNCEQIGEMHVNQLRWFTCRALIASWYCYAMKAE